MDEAGGLDSLKIDPEFGDVELLEDIQAAFDIEVQNSETEKMVTVGDLFDAIVKRFPEPSDRRCVCLSAVAFYALRRSLAASHPFSVVSSDTKVAIFAGSTPLSVLWLQLHRTTGLRMPRLRIGWTPVGPLLRMRKEARPLPKVILGALVLPAALLAIPSVFLTAPFVRQLPAEIETVGELAREVATLNFGRLSRRHNSYRMIDVWNALVSTLRLHATVDGPISRRTKLI